VSNPWRFTNGDFVDNSHGQLQLITDKGATNPVSIFLESSESLSSRKSEDADSTCASVSHPGNAVWIVQSCRCSLSHTRRQSSHWMAFSVSSTFQMRIRRRLWNCTSKSANLAPLQPRKGWSRGVLQINDYCQMVFRGINLDLPGGGPVGIRSWTPFADPDDGFARPRVSLSHWLFFAPVPGRYPSIEKGLGSLSDPGAWALDVGSGAVARLEADFAAPAT